MTRPGPGRSTRPLDPLVGGSGCLCISRVHLMRDVSVHKLLHIMSIFNQGVVSSGCNDALVICNLFTGLSDRLFVQVCTSIVLTRYVMSGMKEWHTCMKLCPKFLRPDMEVCIWGFTSKLFRNILIRHWIEMWADLCYQWFMGSWYRMECEKSLDAVCGWFVVISDIVALCQQRKVRIVMLLIPTKYIYVFCSIVQLIYSLVQFAHVLPLPDFSFCN
jgi:hypothetical protein